MEKVHHEKTNEDLEETFKVLGNQNRLRIMYILANKKDEEATVTEIAQQVNLTQPAASQHLKLLKSVKVVKSNKKGNNTYYKINKATMTKQKECIDTLFYNMLK